MTRIRSSWPQIRRNELVSFAIEDEQWMIHVLAEAAMVAPLLLLTMHRIVVPIQVK